MVCIDPGMSCSESHKSHEELVQKRCRCAASQSNSAHMFLPLCFITGTASPCAWLSTMSMASWGVSECITAIHWNIFESPNEFTYMFTVHSVYARMLMLTHLFRQMLNYWTGLQLYHFGNLWMHGTEISWDARNLDILMAGDAKTQRVKDLGLGTIEMCCDLKWKTRQRASPCEGRMLSPCLLHNHTDFCEPANQRHESKVIFRALWITWSFKIVKFSQKSSSNHFMVIARILFQAPTPSYAADLDELIWIPRTRGVRSTWGWEFGRRNFSLKARRCTKNSSYMFIIFNVYWCIHIYIYMIHVFYLWLYVSIFYHNIIMYFEWKSTTNIHKYQIQTW